MENKENIRIMIMAGILAISFGIKQAIPQQSFENITMDFSLHFISSIFFQILLWMYIVYFLIVALNYGHKNTIKPFWTGFAFDLIITFTIVVIFLATSIIGVILLVTNYPNFIKPGWMTNILIYGIIIISAIFFRKNLSNYFNKFSDILLTGKKIKKQNNPKKTMRNKFYSFIELCLNIIIPTISVIWIGGMLIQIADMTTKDYTPFIEYAKISLTLFGFTLIGAIFEKEKLKNNKIIRKLFHYSIIFLSSSVGFFILYSISFIPFEAGKFFFDYLMPIVIFICMAVGYAGLVYGSLGLLRELISYSKELKSNV